MLRTPHLNPLPLLEGRGEKKHGRCARSPRMLDDFEHLILKRMDSLKPRRQLGLFDATMIVMGGIVGAGIFANPSEVAHRVHTPFLILGVWARIGSSVIPVAFACGGWQTATFVVGEMRDARRDLWRGLLMGVAGVVAL